jgi:hypothetical protein
MTYIGEGGGELSYLSIGATAFVIAFSGPGPRADLVGSIWAIWGISLGMIINAYISAVSIERPARTLAEEVERPLDGLAALVPGIGRHPAKVAAADIEVIAGIKDLLDVAADAQLQGPSSGIDGRNLVDALDTMRRLAFSLANTPEAEVSTSGEFDRSVGTRIEGWLANIRSQLEPGQLQDAPLRAMVAGQSAIGPGSSRAAELDSDRKHIARLIHTLERQLATVSLG